jgi:hypothetical protein
MGRVGGAGSMGVVVENKVHLRKIFYGTMVVPDT